MKRNVLQLITHFFQGGTERQMVQLTRLLHESGRFRVHVACVRGEGPLRGEIDRLGLGEIAEFPLQGFYERNAIAQVRRLAAFMHEREIAIVQAHDFYMNVFGMAAATLARTPVRLASRRDTQGVRTPAQRFVERRAYQLADVVVANAEAVRRELIAEGVPARKIVTLYNGLDLKRIDVPPNQARSQTLAMLELPIGPQRPLVTVVANMVHAMKDQATFLRAARRVRAVVPQAAFALAGEGEQLGNLRALAAELDLTEHVFFLKRCTRVPELLSVSDVCVLSSCGVEGFSNSILEYMAAARPVVATDIGGAREAIVDGETGYIVPPKDDGAMAARIVALLREPKRAREMGARGRRIVEGRFSTEVQLEKMIELYEKMLELQTFKQAGRMKGMRHEDASG